MSPETLASRSYGMAWDQFSSADAIADHALGELADFGSRIQLWGDAERKVLADLEARLDKAEAVRRQAHARLLYTFAELVKTADQT